MPLTSTVETLSRPLQPAGMLANAMLGTRPDFAMPPKPTARFPRTRAFSAMRISSASTNKDAATFPRPSPFFIGRAQKQKRSRPLASRVGFTVGRALGGAVQRNRMKRRLREAVRMSRPVAGIAADVVINPKKSLLTTDFASLQNEVSRAFAVIEQKLSGKANPDAATNRIAEARSPKAESRP